MECGNAYFHQIVKWGDKGKREAINKMCRDTKLSGKCNTGKTKKQILPMTLIGGLLGKYRQNRTLQLLVCVNLEGPGC